MKNKISDIFEGPDSSLRKAFDEATNQTKAETGVGIEEERLRKRLIVVYYKDFNKYSDIDVKFEDVYRFVHQQLQQARETWLRSEIEWLEGKKRDHDRTCPTNLSGDRCTSDTCDAHDFNQAIQTIQARYQKELSDSFYSKSAATYAKELDHPTTNNQPNHEN